MRKNLLIALLTLLIFEKSIAQTSNEAGEARASDNLQTGQQMHIAAKGSTDYATGKYSVSMPIASLPNSLIPISYNASNDCSGIKVNQTAGELGLGWSGSLNISMKRQIEDIPDEWSPAKTQNDYVNIFHGWDCQGSPFLPVSQRPFSFIIAGKESFLEKSRDHLPYSWFFTKMIDPTSTQNSFHALFNVPYINEIPSLNDGAKFNEVFSAPQGAKIETITSDLRSHFNIPTNISKVYWKIDARPDIFHVEVAGEYAKFIFPNQWYANTPIEGIALNATTLRLIKTISGTFNEKRDYYILTSNGTKIALKATKDQVVYQMTNQEKVDLPVANISYDTKTIQDFQNAIFNEIQDIPRKVLISNGTIEWGPSTISNPASFDQINVKYRSPIEYSTLNYDRTMNYTQVTYAETGDDFYYNNTLRNCRNAYVNDVSILTVQKVSLVEEIRCNQFKLKFNWMQFPSQINLCFNDFNFLLQSVQFLRRINTETKLDSDVNIGKVELNYSYISTKNAKGITNRKIFNQSYSSRAFLAGISAYNNNNYQVNNYNFEYHLTSNNQIFHPFTFGFDLWGYYNGKDDQEGGVAAINPGTRGFEFSSQGFQTPSGLNKIFASSKTQDFEAVKAGTLKTIKDLSGTKQDFEYELNSVSFWSGDWSETTDWKYLGGMRIKSITVYNKDNPTFEKVVTSYSYPNDMSDISRFGFETYPNQSGNEPTFISYSPDFDDPHTRNCHQPENCKRSKTFTISSTYSNRIYDASGKHFIYKWVMEAGPKSKSKFYFKNFFDDTPDVFFTSGFNQNHIRIDNNTELDYKSRISGFPGDNSFKRGLLDKIEVYDVTTNNIQLSEQAFDYEIEKTPVKFYSPELTGGQQDLIYLSASRYGFQLFGAGTQCSDKHQHQIRNKTKIRYAWSTMEKQNIVRIKETNFIFERGSKIQASEVSYRYLKNLDGMSLAQYPIEVLNSSFGKTSFQESYYSALNDISMPHNCYPGTLLKELSGYIKTNGEKIVTSGSQYIYSKSGTLDPNANSNLLESNWLKHPSDALCPAGTYFESSLAEVFTLPQGEFQYNQVSGQPSSGMSPNPLMKKVLQNQQYMGRTAYSNVYGLKNRVWSGVLTSYNGNLKVLNSPNYRIGQVWGTSFDGVFNEAIIPNSTEEGVVYNKDNCSIVKEEAIDNRCLKMKSQASIRSLPLEDISKLEDDYTLFFRLKKLNSCTGNIDVQFAHVSKNNAHTTYFPISSTNITSNKWVEIKINKLGKPTFEIPSGSQLELIIRNASNCEVLIDNIIMEPRNGSCTLYDYDYYNGLGKTYSSQGLIGTQEFDSKGRPYIQKDKWGNIIKLNVLSQRLY